MSVFTLFNCESDVTQKTWGICAVMILRLENALFFLGDKPVSDAGLPHTMVGLTTSFSTIALKNLFGQV